MEGLLPSMKSLRGGATAIDRVLDIATGWALSEAQRQLNGGAPVLATDFEIQGTEKEFKGKQHHPPPSTTLYIPGFLGLFWENIHLNEAFDTGRFGLHAGAAKMINKGRGRPGVR